MIYLIESNKYLKIGYAKDANQRFKNYHLHNLEAKLLDSKIGNRKDEKALHTLCKDYHYEGEWFINCKEVKNIFKDYTSIILQDFPKVKNLVIDFANIIKEHKDCPKNTSEWYSEYHKFTTNQKKNDKFVYEYFFDLKNEINLPKEIKEYEKYYKNQSDFWKFVTSPKPGTDGTFQISSDMTVKMSFPERECNTDIELWTRNNHVLINHWNLSSDITDHLSDAEAIIEMLIKMTKHCQEVIDKKLPNQDKKIQELKEEIKIFKKLLEFKENPEGN